MRILFDNVNMHSRSGPNTFGVRLAKALSYRNHIVVGSHESPDVQLSFIQHTCTAAPIVQRLDGIWFNLSNNWKLQNKPIQQTFSRASAVVYQSHFNKELVEKYFGKHQNSHVIHNGTFIDDISKVDPLDAPNLRDFEKVWVCASSWRPHKRLKDNVDYFLQHSSEKDCLVIAGANPDYRIAHTRVFYAGDLEHHFFIPLLRAADFFIHLAYLDHCPNVVVDARAAGAHIICSSSGGTQEIAGPNSTIIEEEEWDFKPCRLYEPPKLDFTKKRKCMIENSIDIKEKAELYEGVLAGVVEDG